MSDLADAIRSLLDAVQTTPPDYGTVKSRHRAVQDLLIDGTAGGTLGPRFADLDGKTRAALQYLLADLWRGPQWFQMMPDAAAVRLTEALATILPKVSENDERDKFCYEQRARGTPHKTIIMKVGKRPKWNPVSSAQHVNERAKNYAKKNHLPWPPRRVNI